MRSVAPDVVCRAWALISWDHSTSRRLKKKTASLSELRVKTVRYINSVEHIGPHLGRARSHLEERRGIGDRGVQRIGRVEGLVGS